MIEFIVTSSLIQNAWPYDQLQFRLLQKQLKWSLWNSEGTSRWRNLCCSILFSSLVILPFFTSEDNFEKSVSLSTIEYPYGKMSLIVTSNPPSCFSLINDIIITQLFFVDPPMLHQSPVSNLVTCFLSHYAIPIAFRSAVFISVKHMLYWMNAHPLSLHLLCFISIRLNTYACCLFLFSSNVLFCTMVPFYWNLLN